VTLGRPSFEQTTYNISGGEKRHDNILAVKAIVQKPTFLKVVFL